MDCAKIKLELDDSNEIETYKILQFKEEMLVPDYRGVRIGQAIVLGRRILLFAIDLDLNDDIDGSIDILRLIWKESLLTCPLHKQE